MPAKTSRDERTYRRGLVMGLTMAEIMVLVIFALLLILAKVLRDQPPVQVVPQPFVALIEKWQRSGPKGVNNFDDNARELIAAADLGAAVAHALHESKMPPPQQTPEHKEAAIRRAAELVKAGRDLEAAVGTNSMGLTPAQAAGEFVKTAGRAFQLAQQKQGHGSSFIWLDGVRKKAEVADSQGKGTEHPPCSATDGKPDFIYDVHLGSTTITVHDNALPAVAGKSTDWPVSSIRFDQPVAGATFLSMTNALFEWSNARQCRFFVRIIDDTLAHEKGIYKIQLRTVGYHFYYYEPLDRSTGIVQ